MAPHLIQDSWQHAKNTVVDKWREFTVHRISWMVIFGSTAFMWIVVTEILLAVAGVPLTFVPVLILGTGALLVVRLLFCWSLALVKKKEKDAVEKPRHVAYAWSCGMMGIVALFVEVFGILELRFEDPLLAMSGLNGLVEQVRLRLYGAGKPTDDWVAGENTDQ